MCETQKEFYNHQFYRRIFIDGRLEVIPRNIGSTNLRKLVKCTSTYNQEVGNHIMEFTEPTPKWSSSPFNGIGGDLGFRNKQPL